MPTYMVLFNYTEQGIRAIDRAAGRLDGLKKRLCGRSRSPRDGRRSSRSGD